MALIEFIAIVIQCVLFAISILLPIFSQINYAKPNNQYEKMHYHQHSQTVIWGQILPIFIYSSIMFKIFILILSESELLYQEVDLEDILFLLGFSLSLALPHAGLGNIIRKTLFIVSTILYTSIQLQQITVISLLNWSEIRQQHLTGIKVLKQTFLYTGLVIGLFLLCYGGSSLIIKQIQRKCGQKFECFHIGYRKLKEKKNQVQSNEDNNSQSSAQSIENLQEFKNYEFIIKFCAICFVLVNILLVFAILQQFESAERQGNISAFIHSHTMVIHNDKLEETSSMNFKEKVLEAIKSICCPFIVGTVYRYFAHELDRLASKNFMVKNVTFIFIVIGVGLGVVRLAAEYT